jgi:thiamine monophosphate synthase
MFPTASHPEKGSEVEGPGLITRVAEALEAEGLRRGVALLGVGGIEPHNCAQVRSCLYIVIAQVRSCLYIVSLVFNLGAERIAQDLRFVRCLFCFDLIGGCRPFLCGQVVQAGADGVCAIGALYKSTDPAATARALLQAMTDAKQTGES